MTSFPSFVESTMVCQNFFKFKFVYLLLLSFQYSLSAADGPGPVTSDLNPVVLFPGLAGSRLEVKADKAYSCRDQNEMGKYQTLWVSIGYLLPSSFDCFLDRFKLFHVEGSDYPQPNEGIHVRAAH